MGRFTCTRVEKKDDRYEVTLCDGHEDDRLPKFEVTVDCRMDGGAECPFEEGREYDLLAAK